MSDTGTRLNGISFSRPPVLPTGGFLIPSTSSPRTLAHTPHFMDDTDDAMGGPDLISLDDGAAHSAQQRRKREDLRPWTDEDRALLRKLHLQNVSANDIARHLGRTGEAVSNMSRRLGLRRRDTALPWTNGELRTLQRMLDDGSSLKQIADATGHPRSSVADKLRRMNVKSLRFRRPWTEEERETVLSLHAAGSSLAAIAQALPDRSIDAVQQKLQELVGPAPFRSPGRTETVRAKPTPKALPTEAPAIAAAPPPEIKLSQPVVPTAPAPAPKPITASAVAEPRATTPLNPLASVDELVRWLRSRDFMVLHLAQGWQVDRHVLDDEAALLEFVNVRRNRLNLPPFITIGATFQNSTPPLHAQPY